VKDHNNVIGNNQALLDQLNAILGTRPFSAPLTLLQTGGPIVLLESQNIDSKLLELCMAASSCTTLLAFITADETEVPADCDLTYVESLIYDDGMHTQGNKLM